MKDEYLEYKTDSVDSLDKVFEYIDVEYYYFNKLEEELKKDILYNEKCISKIEKHPIICKISGYKDINFYKKDNLLLEKELILLDRFDDCYDRLGNDLKEHNYKVVYKLAKFSKYKFLSNYEHLEELRRNNELLYEGFYTEKYKIKDDSQEFIEFFDEEINFLV